MKLNDLLLDIRITFRFSMTTIKVKCILIIIQRRKLFRTGHIKTAKFQILLSILFLSNNLLIIITSKVDYLSPTTL